MLRHRATGAPLICSLGLVGSVLVVLAAWPANTSARAGVRRPWLAGTRGWRWVPTLPVVDLVWLVAMACLVTAWILLRRAVADGDWSTRAVVAVVVLWAVPFVVAPPVGSRDMYSYATHGELRSRGIDPGRSTSARLPTGSPYDESIAGPWRNVVSAYGPVSTAMSWAAVELAGHHLDATVLWLRAWAMLGLAALVAATVALARSYGRNARDALVLMGASPLALVHVVGGGHNEAVMAALMVSALVVARRWRGYGGLGGALVLVGVATAVKLPTALAAVYLGWIGATAGPDRTSRRVVRSVLALAVVAAVIEGVAVAVSVGWGWLVDGVRSGGLVSTSMSMSLALGRALGWLVGRHGLRRRAFAQGVQTFVQALSATVAAWLVLRSPRLGLRALAVGLLVVAVLGAGVQPWYLLWSMPLFITLEAGRRARWLVVAIGVASVCTHPGGGGFFPNPGGWPILTLGLLIAGGWAAWGRRRRLVALLLG